MKNLTTRVGNHEIINDGEFRYVIKKNESKGMIVPVTIYADQNLVSKMALDRTIDQAANVATLTGVKKHVVVLPDGHEGYGFPVGGVAGMDLEEGVISPGGVGYDINCGVRLIRTNLQRTTKLDQNLKNIMNCLVQFHLGSGSSSERSQDQN
jgi:tRNA-splicing ligase RtcB